jgi:formiminoglutamate deiminase
MTEAAVDEGAVAGSESVWCELAWLGGDDVETGVLIEIEGADIVSVRPGVDPPASARRLPGLTLPGLANAHSHCFQRALRARTQGPSGGTFWTWRSEMYALAERLDEARYEALARATFAEMLLAGYTLVGEFDYIHHSEATVRAARAAGVRLTLIDACYLEGGLERFRDQSAEGWCERMTRLVDGGTFHHAAVRPAAAIHSMRAVDPRQAATVATFAGLRDWPLHAHVSEQLPENREIGDRYGMTPTALLARAGALSPRFTAVHGTHMTTQDLNRMAEAQAYCCMCPTTERDLADGIGRVAGVLTLGSDSQSVIDPFEEARAVELDLRLATRTRGRFGAAALARALSADGYASLGWPEGGQIASGAPADLTILGLDSVRLAGTDPAHVLDGVIFAGSAADVSHVMVGGHFVVADGAHVSIDVGAELTASIAALWR